MCSSCSKSTRFFLRSEWLNYSSVDLKLRELLSKNYSLNNTPLTLWEFCNKTHSAQRLYFKIIYLHIIGMKAGWYICDGTSQFPYRNIQSIQKPLFQTWTKWINILVNKYISDMSLYWNVLLYIKYNTISFLFLLFSFCTQSIQNILTYPLKFWRDFDS